MSGDEALCKLGLCDGLNETANLVYSICKEHEEQIKAKDEKIERLTIRLKLIKEMSDVNEKIIKAKDEEIKELGEIVQQYLIPSKNYDAIIRDKDEEIAKLKAQLIAQTTPENIIAMIRNSFSHATVVYTRGSCGRLYKILKEIFPNAIAYENGDHVISKIGDKFWDIKGEVKRTQNFKPCAPNNKMLSNYFGDDLQYIQCPQCDEVFYCGDEDEKDNA